MPNNCQLKEMTDDTIQLILACSATAHLVVSATLAIYARHKVQYLCLAWVNGIFGFLLAGVACISNMVAEGEPGIMHPAMIMPLLCGVYLQSIFPLSIPMPGFLQAKRMIKYARPVIALIAVYSIARLMGSRIIIMRDFQEVFQNLLSSDVLLRVLALGISIYYITNIFLIPRRMVHNTDIPRYLIGYCVCLGFSVVFFTIVSILYNPTALMVYIIIFTLLNLYLAFRTLEDMAIHLPQPALIEVEEEPTEDIVEKAAKEDFNEANLLRFKRIEFWMQKHKEEWTDNTFGRDRLCEAVGYNRHLVLQCVRSQGYYNVHEYINRYRIEELKRLISKGKITTLGETVDAGFGTIQTARSCFLRMEGITLDEYWSEMKKKGC
jgi:AraC-like DNA-binding protein